jgi:hypothetical protein
MAAAVTVYAFEAWEGTITEGYVIAIMVIAILYLYDPALPARVDVPIVFCVLAAARRAAAEVRNGRDRLRSHRRV